jgi:hypothetical protein
MLVENVLVRPLGQNQVSLSWTSDTAGKWSWVFINGRFSLGPFMAEQKERNIVLTIPEGETFRVEVHDFDDDTVPRPIEQEPLVRPAIGWNSVDEASSYRIYHTIFDPLSPSGGTMETLLCEVPPMSGRLEIDCPIRLEGKGGKWHSFRIESVDQFNNESVNEVIPHFAADLPPKPSLTISRDTATGLLNFYISS